RRQLGGDRELPPCDLLRRGRRPGRLTSYGRRPPPSHADAALRRPAAARRRRGRNGRRGARPARAAVARPTRPAVRVGAEPPPAHPRVRRPGPSGARHAARSRLARRGDLRDQRRLSTTPSQRYHAWLSTNPASTANGRTPALFGFRITSRPT